MTAGAGDVLDAVIVHAHCYQPPREDPWLETVEAEPSALPDHDWNARIDRECYARLGACEVRAANPRARPRDPDAHHGLARIVNLYAWCSFDVGATLCEWLDAEAPATLAAMVAGDRASVARWGHGNAIAAPYHHVILPLASRRDKVTEVRWGIADFTRRFGRAPEGMWLPECAADDETLEVLADEGIRFTILAPYQVPEAAGHRGFPVRWEGSGGRSLAIVPYDGSLAGEVAFGGLLRDAESLAERLAPHAHPNADPRHGAAPCVTTLATDGETFGHHHRGGDATLAAALARVRGWPRARLTNAAALVASHPPDKVVSLVSPSSWSCAHGVERWRSDCGCRLDHQARTSQRWRRPLREALTWLAERCHGVFEREGVELFRDDPWAVRDGYGTVVAQDGDALAQFVRAQLRADAGVSDAGVSGDGVSIDDRVRRARELLELQRAVLRTFTSCAWFFDDVARIEARQVLRYAARALELSGAGARLSPEFVQALGAAMSNNPALGTAADLFVREAMPHRPVAVRVAAAALALAHDGQMAERIDAYDVEVRGDPRTGQAAVACVHRRTGVRTVWSGTVAGAGPAVRLKLAPGSDAAGAASGGGLHELAVHDLPESAARRLLARHADHDRALDA
jgi:alpha-amylase/alpha-mannosidase (GH57 family)